MDGNRFSAIGHRGMEFWNPVSGGVVDQWIDGLRLSPTAQILDIGCGRAELLRRMHQRHACACIGIEPSPLALDAGIPQGTGQTIDGGEVRAINGGEAGAIDLRLQKFRAHDFDAASLRGIACIGSTHAVGDTLQCLQVLGDLLHADGWLWLGLGYWQRDPDQGYLDFLQCGVEEMLSHEGTMQFFHDHGWKVTRHHLATAEEWSTYEDGYAANIQNFLAAHPQDPDVAAMKERIEAWRRAYLQWGRTTMGFGMYLLESG